MKKILTYDEVQHLYSKTLDLDFAVKVGAVLKIVDDYIAKYGFTKDDFTFEQYENGYISVADVKNTEGKESEK